MDELCKKTKVGNSEVRVHSETEKVFLTAEYDLAYEVLPFMTSWMDAESIMLSKVSQSKKDRYHVISPTCEI